MERERHGTSKRTALTPSQRQLVQLICRSPVPSVQDLCDFMGCTPKTIEAHRAEVYRKWQVHTRIELLLRALQEGLVRCPRCGATGRPDEHG